MYEHDLFNDKNCIFQAMRRILTGFYDWLILENKTDTGPCDNFVQLIKAHCLHTLFAVFVVQTVRLDELNSIVTWANTSFNFQN